MRALSPLVLLILLAPSQGAPAFDWEHHPGYRTAGIAALSGRTAGFTPMTPEMTGVAFTNVLTGDMRLTNNVAHNGSGVAIGDADGDGWPDVYLCSLQGPNRLYRNLSGWRFEEVPIGAADCRDQLSTGAAFADVDGDADLDLLVNGISAGTRLFLNDGRGGWNEAGDGLSRTNSATSLALADMDGDGDLDLYCTHYLDNMILFDPTTRFALARREGRWVVTRVNGQPASLPRWKDRFEALPDGRVRELPEADALYRNEGQGRFAPVQNQGAFLNENGEPIPAYRDWGLAVMFRDLNGDGHPDIYVCNDNASPDRIWINTGKGTFRPIEWWKFRHTSRSSMGLDFADVDRDGHDDLIVVDMLAREHSKRMTQLVRDVPAAEERANPEARPRFNRNTLFFGRADGSFVEAALLAGVAASDWSWCPIFLDVDLDGYEDLLVTNGFEFDVLDQDAHDRIRSPRQRLTEAELKRSLGMHPRWPTKNAAFRNRGDGTFEPANWGFELPGVSHGMALGDLDNDGDLDVVINNLNAGATLLRNDAAAARIAVRLKGIPPNTEGIGARISLAGASLTQSQEMICGGRYLSGDQALRVFAADPRPEQPMRLEVRWRNGQRTVLPNVQANRIYEIDQAASGVLATPEKPRESAPLFSDASSLIGGARSRSSIDRSVRQPLTPYSLDPVGPDLGWRDLDGDGWEDLIIISANDRATALLNVGGKSFREFERPMAEFLRTNAVFARGTNLAQTICAADVDADGDLDLFVGGRYQAGRFPAPAASKIWLNERGDMRPAEALSAALEPVGAVNGAVFCDLDQDGDPDLALAVEWGPVRIFLNENGRFEEKTTAFGFGDKQGFWSSIAAGDFDGDGKVDLAAGNWGRNMVYELYRPGPLRLYHGDWNGDGAFETMEAWRNGANWVPVRAQPWFAGLMPELERRFPTHEAFGHATVEEILGAHFRNSRFLEANFFDSAVFLNRGGHFQCRPLPREAQWTPVLGIYVADFDGDGAEDLFLAQNFFGFESDLTRDDGGQGLWLRGNGNGSFTPVASVESGIRMFGEQRAAAVADFNHDGRVDLAAGENHRPAKLYLNERGRRGLRVTLEGPAQNPDGIGAQIRVVYADGRKGPVRTVLSGPAFGLGRAAPEVLGTMRAPAALSVRWLGNGEQIVSIPENVWDLRVRFKP